MFYVHLATYWFRNDQNWLKNKVITLCTKLMELFPPVFNAKIAACLGEWKEDSDVV
jgi:hypothetical protein